MARTNRKAVYILPKHHEILRRIAYEENCNLADVLDEVFNQIDWIQVEKQLHQANRSI